MYQTNIHRPKGGIKPATCHPYLDTVEVFFPCTLTQEQYRALKRIGWVKECRDRRNRLWGYRLIRNQPDVQTLLRLDHAASRYRGVLCRFDLAVDLPGFLRERIVRTALLRWAHGPMRDYNETIYWVQWPKGKRRPSRNLVLYEDECNRITGELDCTHLELRFLRAAVIRRQGIHRVRDLININPSALLEKHVRWSDDADRHVSEVVRRAVKADCEKYRGRKTSALMDRYRADRHRRVRSIYIAADGIELKCLDTKVK